MIAVKLFKAWFPLALGLAAGAVLGLVVIDLPRLVQAQGGGIDDTITYQGRLKLEDPLFPTYVDGVCNFQFDLYADVSGTTPLATLTQTLTLSEGYFKADLNFGDQYSIDQSHFLDVMVQCPDDAGWVQMSERIPLKVSPYAQSVPWEGIRGRPDVPTASAGYGLALDDTVFSVVTGTIQSRITGVCPASQKIIAVNGDGSVTCAADQNTTYIAGEGLKIVIPEITKINVDTEIVQARVAPCPDGRALRVIDTDGGVTCEEFVGTLTAGDGLTQTVSTGGVEVSVEPLATNFIADGAVTSLKIAGGTVISADIGTGEVTSADIANNTIVPQDLSDNGCVNGSLFENFGTGGWGCGNASVFTLGKGLVFSGTIVQVDVADFVGDGLVASSINNARANFAGTGSANSSARSDHGHSADYDITMGSGSTSLRLNDRDTNDEYIFPSGASYNLSRASSCLVVANTYLDTTGSSSVRAAYLRTARQPTGGAAQADVSFGPYYNNSRDIPSVSVSYVWPNVSGTGSFGCFLGIENDNINDDETLYCRVSFVCQSD